MKVIEPKGEPSNQSEFVVVVYKTFLQHHRACLLQIKPIILFPPSWRRYDLADVILRDHCERKRRIDEGQKGGRSGKRTAARFVYGLHRPVTRYSGGFPPSYIISSLPMSPLRSHGSL